VKDRCKEKVCDTVRGKWSQRKRGMNAERKKRKDINGSDCLVGKSES